MASRRRESHELTKLAEALGKRPIPLFIFHECADTDAGALHAKPIFKQMATSSGGVYCEFRPEAGDVLRELLASVAAFSSAGIQGVQQVGRAATPEGQQLQGRLLLLAPSSERNG